MPSTQMELHARRGLRAVAGAFLMLAPAGPVLAQESMINGAIGDRIAAQAMQEQFEAIRAEMEALRTDNQRMRGEIDELRLMNDDNWLTEQRAEEIRGIVHDVLADADVRASLLANGVMAGWSDHFFLASHDGRFKLQLDGQMQTRFLWNFHDEPDTHRRGFEITRSKLTFRGHVFNKNLTYLMRLDITRNEPGLVTGLSFLQDAWVRYQFNNDWSVRFGQFKLPFNREELVSSARQQAVERSLLNEQFNLGRSQGVELLWAPEGGFDRIAFMFSDTATDSAGGFNLVGLNGLNTPALTEDTEWAITARYEHLFAGSWEQFSDITSPVTDEFGVLFGLAAHWQLGEGNGAFTFNRDEDRWLAVATDLSLEFGGANIFAQLLYHYFDTPSVNVNFWGGLIQGGFYVAPKIEVFGRFEYGWTDTNQASFNDLTLITMGMNYYFEGHDVKLTTDIGFGISRIDQVYDSDVAGWRRDIAADPPQVVFRMQFQLLF